MMSTPRVCVSGGKRTFHERTYRWSVVGAVREVFLRGAVVRAAARSARRGGECAAHLHPSGEKPQRIFLFVR